MNDHEFRSLCSHYYFDYFLYLVYFPIFLAVGALKVRGLRLARPNTTRCHGIRMNLFDRFSRVVKVFHESYANALISTFEDPEKILEQAVTDMNDDLIKMRQATAQVCIFLLYSYFWMQNSNNLFWCKT